MDWLFLAGLAMDQSFHYFHVLLLGWGELLVAAFILAFILLLALGVFNIYIYIHPCGLF